MKKTYLCDIAVKISNDVLVYLTRYALNLLICMLRIYVQCTQ